VSHLPIIKEIKEKGRVVLKDADNRTFLWVLPKFWDNDVDGNDGVFLLYDTFQIRSVGEQFSEVALDIVEFSNKPVIFHTPVSKFLLNGPVQNGNVKFFMMKNPEWKKLLFGISQPIVMKAVNADTDHVISVSMPVLLPHTKEMYLGAEGQVKILDL
jgi:hypothetical protein